MKRILLALITIIASVSLTAATTTAAWSDTVSATGIQIDTASTSIQVSVNHKSTWSSTSGNSPFHITNLIPNHQNDGGYAFDIAQIDGDLLNGVALSGQIASTNMDGLDGAEKANIQIQVYDIDNPADASAWSTLAAWEAGPISFNSTVLQPTAKQYGLRVWLAPVVDNNWQNKAISFTMQVTGTQL